MGQRNMKKTGRRKRRAFTPEYKAEVVRLCRESGRSPETIGKDLDLSGSLVRTWVRQAEAEGVSDVSASEKEELQRLRQEVKQLRQERDILRRATAFFVKEATS